MTGESSTRVSYTNSFSYDGDVGNGPGNPTGFKGQVNTFNADNQQTGTGFGYDGAGNPTTYKGQALAFDPENRMASDSTGGQTDGYEGDGLRAWKQSGGGKTYFLYDGSQPVAEYASSGTLLAINMFGASGLVSRRVVSTSATTFYTFDERGNVSQRTSSTGAVQSSDVYDAYGTRTSTASQADPVGFGGQWGYLTDTNTGLVLCTHRFYDPQNGRWLTRDPISYRGGVNLYGYVGNDPVNESDPSGFDNNNGTAINNTGSTQYGLGGYDPSKYKPGRGGATGTVLNPIPPNAGPSYPVYLIPGAPAGDDYMFPVGPGKKVGGNGVDVDAGWDPARNQWSKIPGTNYHGFPIPGNTASWKSCIIVSGDDFALQTVFVPPWFGPGGTDFSKDLGYSFARPTTIMQTGVKGKK